MRVAILTTGRFHVCDLARELHALGNEVAFYSMVPPARTAEFGLPYECNRFLLPWAAPLLSAIRAARGRMIDAAHDAATSPWVLAVLDRIAASALQPCDVLIMMSGMFPITRERARRKYGARIFVERGSRHILSQREILGSIPQRMAARPPISERTVRRELEDYREADVIVVPSKHAARSFEERGVPSGKLFCNPYGVNLDMFAPTRAPESGPPTIITVGHWSLRKGCDVLTEAWQRLEGVRLLHVGRVLDAPVPLTPGFEHHDPVEQRLLREYYAQAHVFALASREEGLAVVQAQALSCGLELVCTDRTGGEDLAELLGIGDENVSVVPAADPGAFAGALQRSLARSTRQRGLRRHGNPEALSWRAYGERYQRALEARV